jgi:hypothetical protein
LSKKNRVVILKIKGRKNDRNSGEMMKIHFRNEKPKFIARFTKKKIKNKKMKKMKNFEKRKIND